MTVQQHRKARLKELIVHSCNDVIATFAERIDRSGSYVSRMLYPMDKAGSKPISDKMMLVIEAAFDLDRAWLDMPLGTYLPGGALGVPHNTYEAREQATGATSITAARTQWPFKLATPSRISALKSALGPKRAGDALDDIDRHLDIVLLKWEQEAQRSKPAKSASRG